MNEKLTDIGKKLNVSKQDIKKVKEHRASTSKGRVKRFLLILFSAISFTLGFFTGRSAHPVSGYPYAMALTVSAGSRDREKDLWTKVSLFLPLITFLLGLGSGLMLSPRIYPVNILYGVYGKEGEPRQAFPRRTLFQAP